MTGRRRRRGYGRGREQFAAGTADAVAAATAADTSESAPGASGYRRTALPRRHHRAVDAVMLRSWQRHHAAADDCRRSDDAGHLGRDVDRVTCSVVAEVRGSRLDGHDVA